MEDLPFWLVQSSQEDDMRKLFRKAGRYGEAYIFIHASVAFLREYCSQVCIGPELHFILSHLTGKIFFFAFFVEVPHQAFALTFETVLHSRAL